MNRKFKKKPVVIEAFQYGTDEFPEWFKEACRDDVVTMFSQYGGEVKYCEIETLEGTHRCNHGDWVAKGVDGELYPIKHSIFIKTYEEVGREG